MRVKQSPTQKLLLLLDLMKDGKRLSIEQIAMELSINYRTAFRYLDRIKDQGHPLHAETVEGSHAKVYWLESEEKSPHRSVVSRLHRMDLDLTIGGSRKFHRTILDAIRILDPQNVYSAHGEAEIDPEYHLDHGPLAERLGDQSTDSSSKVNVLDKIQTAIREGKILNIHYTASDSEQPDTFEFEPYFLSLRVGKLYLLGYKRLSHTNERLNLVFQRIKMVQVLQQKFSRKEKLQVQDFYKHCFGQWVPKSSTVPLEIQIKPQQIWMRKYLEETHFDPKIQWKQGVAYLKLYETPDLEKWLLGLIPDADILAPLELRKKIRQRLQDAAKFLK